MLTRQAARLHVNALQGIASSVRSGWEKEARRLQAWQLKHKG
jgi:hypothetical protein